MISFWIRESQSDKIIFASGRLPFMKGFDGGNHGFFHNLYFYFQVYKDLAALIIQPSKHLCRWCDAEMGTQAIWNGDQGREGGCCCMG